jgi:uncharacterized protein (DUF2062 family)
MSPFRLGVVQLRVSQHCKKLWTGGVLALCICTLLAAVILLIATLLQTVYTIVPFYTEKQKFLEGL